MVSQVNIWRKKTWGHYSVNPFPHPRISAAKPFRRGTAWTSSASLRELGRLRHLVELLVPTTRRAETAWERQPDISRAESVVQRMAGSFQPFFVIRRQSWITTHITISASPVRAPLARRAAQDRVDGRQGTRVRCAPEAS